jgi:hypothetical protein
VPLGIAEAAGGVVGVLQVAAGGPGASEGRHQLGRLHSVPGLGVHRHGNLYPRAIRAAAASISSAGALSWSS